MPVPPPILGYCTNVHSGADWPAALRNLQRYAPQIRQAVCPDQPLGIGLWLSDHSAAELLHGTALDEFSRWLAEQSLVPFTMNGFPFGDFHQPVVKHRVFHPDWRHPARAAYTRRLISILSRLLPDGSEAGISTLPLGWNADFAEPGAVAQAADNLLGLIDDLRRVADQRGQLIHIDLEPEPGCVLQTSTDVVSFFEHHLRPRGDPPLIARHLRVCHDICHVAVMFEDQGDTIQRYRDAGIGIGKVQVSSALHMTFEAFSPHERLTAIDQLRQLHEHRYLHQTVVQRGAGISFYDDLADAVRAMPADGLDTGAVRIHFHVPIFLERIGLLETTQPDIEACLKALDRDDPPPVEVETYAWDVLPPELRATDVASGIAEELTWLSRRWPPRA